MARPSKLLTGSSRTSLNAPMNAAMQKPEAPKLSKKQIKSAFGEGFFEPFMWGGWGNMSMYLALQYYRQVSSLAIAVDKISDKVSYIAPIIYDNKKEMMLQKDSRQPSLEILKLLQYPNADVAFGELIKRWNNFYKITGNAFFLATGDVDKPPLELFVPPSQNITLIPGADGFTQTMHLNTGAESETFHRTWVKGRHKYYNRDGTAELYHTRAFNPYIGGGVQNYGISELCAIYYEIEQHILSSIHNLSLLNKGARTTGAFINSGEPLTDDQFVAFQQQINMMNQGANNAGRTLLLEGGEGGGMEFIEMGLTSKDMDWARLSEVTSASIYKRLKIPLALIDTSSMTYDNYSTANIVFYDDAVLPDAQKMYQEMTDFLMHRYPYSEDNVITYDLDSVEALRTRTLMQAERKNALGVFTINEIRADLGYEPLEGGDVLLKPYNLAPIAHDGTPSHVSPANIWSDEYANNGKIIPFEAAKKSRLRTQFIANMQRKYVNYSAYELDKLANYYGF